MGNFHPSKTNVDKIPMVPSLAVNNYYIKLNVDYMHHTFDFKTKQSLSLYFVLRKFKRSNDAKIIIIKK